MVFSLGCEKEKQQDKTYTIAGRVLDNKNNPIPSVTISFQKFGTATTGQEGYYNKHGLEGEVEITPTKEDWKFEPKSKTVNSGSDKVHFTGTEIQQPAEIKYLDCEFNAYASTSTIMGNTYYHTEYNFKIIFKNIGDLKGESEIKLYGDGNKIKAKTITVKSGEHTYNFEKGYSAKTYSKNKFDKLTLKFSNVVNKKEIIYEDITFTLPPN
ncbi:carboxypeptidase-like regulatory domain-containing protein [Halanaerobacter jeridensis]|uniref:carboxypeptidase-like regulatory domain-containing protein n=1 Tax=Halanaerobacter jeridensis TaxID=706427 RepID=UPI00195BB1BA|nr:carboxypeptidase-like regulatory domain-containing protein [Halanaerobacter jeridensis]